MILSDVDIKKAIKEKRIVIKPPPTDEQFSSTSLDLHIGTEFKEWNGQLVKQTGVDQLIDFSKFDFKDLALAYTRDLPQENDGSFILKPNAFILVPTHEWIHLPLESQLAARVQGRSTAARLGFTVHLSAPTIHAGWRGNITLEIVNLGPFSIALDPKKDRVCQLIFEQVSSLPLSGNKTTFQGQTSPTGH